MKPYRSEVHATASKSHIEIVEPGSSLLLIIIFLNCSKEPATLKEQFPTYIQPLQLLSFIHKGDSNPLKDEPA